MFRSGQRICGLAQTLDRRAHHRVAQSLPKACQGLGESQPKSARVLAPCLNPPHAQKTQQSGLKSPDGLLGAVSFLGGFRTPAAEPAALSFKRPASETLHKNGLT